MKHMRMLAMAGLACLALAGPMALSGCTPALQAAGNAVVGPPTTDQQVDVYSAEQAYTSALTLGTVWLKSGKATKAQASTAKSMENALFADLVVVRTAVANKDSPAVALGLKIFKQAQSGLTSYIASNGGGT